MGILARLQGAACETQPIWCAAVRGWEGASHVTLAEGEHVAVGLTIGLEEAATGAPAFDEATVSVLAWRRHADQAVGRIVELTPASDEEKLETAEARRRIEELLLGRALAAALPPRLAGDLRGFSAGARYPLQSDRRGWLLHAAARAELRRVGDTWVAVEVPPRGPRGVFVSVFTERWTSAR